MIAILHNIRSVYNVGSIFRTADACGIEKVYLCGITPSPLDQFGKYRQDFSKTALGAEKTVAWEKISSTTRLLDKLKKDGFQIFAVEQSTKSVPYHKLNLTKPDFIRLGVVVGSEVKGLSAGVLKRVDKTLEIPMRGVVVRQAHHPRHSGRGKESLNVSVAFGIVVYQLKFGNKMYG